MNDTVTAFTEYGAYVPVYQRLPDFTKKFPFEEGYSIVTEVTDLLSFKPGLLQCYLECARAGHTPESVGLPPIDGFDMLVFTSKLLKDGKVIHSGSTCQGISFEKDYENGETNALQRLISRCGFPGDPLDLERSTNLGCTIGRVDTSTESDDLDDIDAQSDPEPAIEDTPTTVQIPQPAPSDTPAHLQHQVDVLCASLDASGQDYTKPTSKVDALQFIRNHRGGNGVSP